MNRTRFRHGALLALATSLLLAACGRNEGAGEGAAATDPVPPAARQAAAVIEADFLREHIREFSDDSFEGRGPATPGDEKARAWLVSKLQDLGLEPGGPDGAWEQPFEIIGTTSTMPAQWEFRAGSERLRLALTDQYVGTGGTTDARVDVRDAEVVFVGYGIQAPEYQWDDFKGMDLKGKILLMLNNDPDWDPALFQGETRLYYGRWSYKYESAARQGAAGAIIIHTQPSAGYPFQVVQSGWTGEQFSLPSTGAPALPLQTWVTEDSAQALARLGGQDLAKLVEAARSRDFQPVPLGVRTSISIRNAVTRKTTANVAGLLRGSDPSLANEVVVYTAHFDHLGVGEPDAEGDRIFNGAVDNASGVAEVLAIAKAFKALPQPPRRSVLFLFVAAEEQGLLGSQWYSENPTFPPGRIAANINIDSGNVFGRTSEVIFIGKGKSTLDEVVERYARAQGRTVQPDEMSDRGFFYRSDQFNFARIGVPAFYSHTATKFIGQPEEWGRQQLEEYEAKRYHQPSDEFDPAWNYEGMIEDAQLAFWAGLDVASADTLPAWVPGDEFEAARKAALAAVSGSAGSPANTGR
jgi:Zn-dependent M28 family amino/carboxypeptidase